MSLQLLLSQSLFNLFNLHSEASQGFVVHLSNLLMVVLLAITWLNEVI